MSDLPEPSPHQPVPDALEAFLRECLAELPEPTSAGRGRPPLLATFVLWAGLLVCLLRGFASQRTLWQLVCFKGLWRFPRVEVTVQAVYDRLKHLPPEPFLRFFAQLTSVLRTRYQAVNDLPWAPFATEILALDHTKLDPVFRKLKIFRGLPPGDWALRPGQLATLFDLRRQLFVRVEFWEDPRANEKHGVNHWLDHLAPGTLLLCDLGFFAFPWFDRLTEHGCYYISRFRNGTSYQVLQTLFDGPAGPVHLRDCWVYLGAYRADRAGHAVRLVEIVRPNGQRHRFITNVLDPTLLPAAHVQHLYRRRWDIEQAFLLLKSHLNLFLLWSGQPNVITLQVYATLTLAQVLLALRLEVAQAAKASLQEVSLPQLLRWVPELAAPGVDPLAVIAARGRYAQIIRPVRRRPTLSPEADPQKYTVPEERPPPRATRYAGKQHAREPSERGPFGTPTRGWPQKARRPRRA